MAEDRLEYSERRLRELRERVVELDELLGEHRLCVYATGSYGRLEAWRGSDIDLFFLYDDAEEAERLPWTTFVRLAAHLIAVTAQMDFPPFSGDGRYLDVQYVAEMEKVLGSPDDDFRNSFTARMLLLLESQPIYREDVYDSLLKRFQRLRSQGDKADRLVDAMEALYSEFLAEVQHPEPKLLKRFANESTRKDALAQAAHYGDLIYELLGEVAAPERLRSLVI